MLGQGLSHAQTPDASQDEIRDEIIVTATKRAQNVQDVAISMAVFREQDIETLRTPRLSELSQFIPNMYLPPAGEAGQNDMTIRGVGGGINRSAGRAVGVYIDGVYISADTQLNIGLADIEQVEVLRGPQGTLFGRNTIGGAVNITTRQEPLSDTNMTGRMQVEFGSLGHRKALVRANIPLLENRLSVSLSGLKTKQDGYIRNLSGGASFGREDHSAYQAQLNFAPTDKLSGRLIYSYQKIDDNPNSQGEPITNIGADQIPYTVNTDQDERQTQNAQRASLHLTFDTDLGYSLQSISAWSDVNDFYIQDGDRLPQAITVNQFDGANEDISQEFRIISPSFGRFDYVAGLYYLKTQRLYSPTFPLMHTAFLSQVFFLPVELHPPDRLDGQRIISNDESIAVYGHGNFRLNDKFNLFAGVRLTRDKKTVDYSIFGETFALFGLQALQTTQSLENTPISWSVGGTYKPHPNINFYGQVARAFRSATVKDDFIGQADLDAPTGFFTKPEFVTNFEAGFKLRGFDQALRLDASVFYMDYTDIQVSVSKEPFLFLRTLTNAAKARIWGFEVDMAWQVLPDLNLSANAGYLKTRYDEFMPEPGRDLAGTGFGTAPEFSFSAAVDYKRPVMAGDWKIHFDYSNQTAPDDFQLRNLPFTGSHALVNAWTGYTPANANWSVKLWVRNLANFDKPTTNFHWGAGLGPLLDNVTQQHEKPRTYGISFDYQFGN
ncbi:MAG: TonB-dependent receptor [Robiginitomaculum sp.]|nr:TonB-dependent receptor [Robiginitomaculum sp.]